MIARRRPATVLLVLLAGLLPACTSPPTGSATTPTDSSVEPSPTAARPAPSATVPPAPAKPAVVLPDGTQVTLELAVTPEEHEQGLMFRPDVPAQRGMLFLFSEPSYPRFWMKNTWTPLDIVFLDDRGAVLSVVHDAPPCREEPCPEYSPGHVTSAVLEMRAGSARQHGVEVATTLQFEHVPGYPAPG